jgi:hypothetical protein
MKKSNPFHSIKLSLKKLMKQYDHDRQVRIMLANIIDNLEDVQETITIKQKRDTEKNELTTSVLSTKKIDFYVGKV